MLRDLLSEALLLSHRGTSSSKHLFMNDKSALLLDALLLSEALLWTLTLVGSMSFDILNESSDYVLLISHTPHAW